ncbi:putative vacuolar protein-sorting-associated protein 24 [Triangularia verruculosa]|uniref:Vacuolar protein-sorting-associated protein 24 n=1 Tax=Triangularia verruculosa TaxID=2587418 RepID=A0AAN6XQ96_9PEZI|nr:putative vacuolar protein-sorting-associated protein 24 [Triangularia verruculosa]
METFRSLFTKPDPQAQVRKCNALLRQNIRRIDRDILNAKSVETKTKNLILAADKRAQRLGPNHQQTEQAQKEIRDFARELVKRRKETNRLHTFKAQLTSVQMQVNEAFALRKIEGSIKASVGIMKDVNTLIRLPELAGTMQELSVELMKAGIIEEMVGDALPETEVYEEEEEEAEEEVEKILGEILKDRMDKTGAMPSAPLPQKQPAQQQQQVEEDDEEDTEAMMDQMRNRLEALRS